MAIVYGEDELLALTLAVAYMPLAFALQAPTWIFFRRMDFLRQRLLLAVGPVVMFVSPWGSRPRRGCLEPCDRPRDR